LVKDCQRLLEALGDIVANGGMRLEDWQWTELSGIVCE